jgi:hypothetical protein
MNFMQAQLSSMPLNLTLQFKCGYFALMTSSCFFNSLNTEDPLVNTKYTAFVGDTYVARTVASYINGMGIIDEDAIFKPIGDLSLSTAGGYKAINGLIASANLGDGSVVAMNMAGRSYSLNLTPMAINKINAFGCNTQHNDQYELTSQAEYLVNGGLATVNGVRIGYIL